MPAHITDIPTSPSFPELQSFLLQYPCHYQLQSNCFHYNYKCSGQKITWTPNHLEWHTVILSSSETKAGSRDNIQQTVEEVSEKHGSVNVRLSIPRIFFSSPPGWGKTAILELCWEFPASDVSIPAAPLFSYHPLYPLPLMPFYVFHFGHAILIVDCQEAR